MEQRPIDEPDGEVVKRALGAGRRRVAVAGLLVAALLLVLVWFPGTFVGPVSEDPLYDHRAEPASTDAYEERLRQFSDRSEVSEDDLEAVRYEDLSPGGQRLFDRTRAADPDPDGTRSYEPVVCEGRVLLCPGLHTDDLPAEFTYRHGVPVTDGSLIVVADGERYLFSTSAITATLPHGDFGAVFSLLFRYVALVPVAAFLLTYAAGVRASTRARTAGAVVATVVLAAIALRQRPVIGELWVFVGAPLVCIAALVPPTDDRERKRAAVVFGALVAVFSVVVPYLDAYLQAYTGVESRVLGVAPAVAPVVALCGLLAFWVLGIREHRAAGDAATPSAARK